MSALWSLTYLKTTLTERELFDTVVECFRLELDGKLYGLEWTDSEEGDQALIPVKARELVVEWFETPQRARMITDALMTERMGHGVFVYPKHNDLFALSDSVVQIADIWQSARARQIELAEMLKQRPDPLFESLFLYMNFLNHLSEQLNAEAVHILFERNPAGEATGIHFHKAGQLVDSYFVDSVDSENYEPLIELPQHPDVIGQILDQRFAFLLNQPKHWSYGDGEEDAEVYFGAEHLDLGAKLAEYDVFNLLDSDLYVPFWEEDMLPVGAVYCLDGEFPDYFLNRYTDSQ